MSPDISCLLPTLKKSDLKEYEQSWASHQLSRYKILLDDEKEKFDLKNDEAVDGLLFPGRLDLEIL